MPEGLNGFSRINSVVNQEIMNANKLVLIVMCICGADSSRFHI